MIYKELSKDEEKPFREWARKNFEPGRDISGMWHPVVQAECVAINRENATFVKE